MVGRLEDYAIAKLRARMARASICELVEILKEIQTDCKGGNESMDFTESLTRDCYAYALINFFNLFGYQVFGGFVSSHLTGKYWNDLDFLLPFESHPAHVTRVLGFLRLAFGFMPAQIMLEDDESRRKYSKRYKLSISDSISTHLIKMDFVMMDEHAPIFCPVTIGRCLIMRNNVISIRNIPIIRLLLLPWDVNDIIQLLKSGEDIGLVCKQLLQNNQYSDYFWSRITKIRKSGIAIETFIGGKLPPTRT